MKTLSELIKEKQGLHEPTGKELNQLIAYKMIYRIMNHTATPSEKLVLEEAANLIEKCYNKLDD